jgi:hypothetical protein
VTGRAVAATAGALVVAAHAVAMPLLIDGCRRDELAVRVRGGAVAATFDLDGDVPAGLRDRVEARVDGVPAASARPGPGLHRRSWHVGYRGGYARAVGAAQLVGPFQDAAAPPCSGRLVVGQRFLDDGAAGPGTVAALVRDQVALGMKGFSQFPVGDFDKVTAVEARWARFGEPEDPELFGALLADPGAMLGARWRTEGYARVRLVLAMDRVDAEVIVALVPRVDTPAAGATRLAFEVFTVVHLDFGNRVVDFAADVVDADARVTRVAREQLDAAILQAFDPPPPLPLPGGRALEVVYCPGAQIEVSSRGHAALPLALKLSGPAGADGARPPAFGRVAPAPPAPDTTLAFDLDLDALNALLFELWRTGFLDEQLDAAGLDRRFNADPTVASLLTLRMSPLRLALPPVVSPGPRGLRMAADLRVQLADGAHVTPARVWAALDVALTPTDGAHDVALAELELACEPAPGVLRPCYADLVGATRARAADARAELSAVLRDILERLFTGQRVAAPGTPAELVLGAPVTSARLDGASATVHLAIPARLEPVP